jgi:hypothetical protein
MIKIALTTIATLFTLANCFAQDIITKKNSEDIQAKVIEVGTSEIKYKKFDNQNGPTFTLLKSDVLMIRYENGSKDVFTEAQSNLKKEDSVNDIAFKAKQDAIANYKGKNSGAVWTGASALALSPLIALVPAAITTSSEPSDENLNYKNPDLMKDYTYSEAYTKQAHKIKKRKIWTSYGIGSGAWLLLVLIL